MRHLKWDIEYGIKTLCTTLFFWHEYFSKLELRKQTHVSLFGLLLWGTDVATFIVYRLLSKLNRVLLNFVSYFIVTPYIMNFQDCVCIIFELQNFNISLKTLKILSKLKQAKTWNQITMANQNEHEYDSVSNLIDSNFFKKKKKKGRTPVACDWAAKESRVFE